MSGERPVLVTGAAGFIGRPLVEALCREGARVRVVVRRQESAADWPTGTDVVVGDLLDEGTVRVAARGVEAVFHLAGRLFSPGVADDVYERLHVGATVALMEACAIQGSLKYFVLCSTTGIHGPTTAAPAREDDAGQPLNAYEITKARAEAAASEAAHRCGLPLTIARPGLVYGPGDRHLLGWFRAIQNGYYRVIGPGTNCLHPIYIDDVVRALMLCRTPNIPGRAYHLVGSRPMSMRELSDRIGAAVGRRVPAWHLPSSAALAIGAALELLPLPRRVLPLTRSRVRFMLQNRAYDGSRARDELGFVPQTEITDGLSKTVAWYRASGLL